MKKIAFILLLFSCSLSSGQNFVVVEKLPEESNIVYIEKEYNEWLTHTPKSFVSNMKSKPQNRVLLCDLNSIRSLELRYAYLQQLQLNATEIKWLEDEINQLAIAFYTDGKPVIIKRTGNYTDCKGKGLEKKNKNGVDFTILYFCFANANGEAYENRFLEIFNTRMENLIASKK